MRVKSSADIAAFPYTPTREAKKLQYCIVTGSNSLCYSSLAFKWVPMKSRISLICALTISCNFRAYTLVKY